jgi:diguanylate cyclase (GGDEF)-like protein
LISIKKYLDTDSTSLVIEESEANELQTATMDSYRSALCAMGKSAVEACPATARELERGLTGLAGQLSLEIPAKAVTKNQELVEDVLQRWGSSTAAHLRGKADEVKELLLMLARTAESVGERDQRYAGQIGGLTADLKAIANLDDLTQVRASLVRKATELKSCVDQMARDGEQSLAQLRTKVSVYEDKLKTVEKLASKDTLTGLANRRGVEARMEWNISMDRRYCVVMLDLNLFKAVNDKHGHVAGDDLLKKFSLELQKNVRADDLVGRWGGDEFVIVLARDLEGAKSQVQRIKDWVFGDFAIETGTGKGTLKITVAASIGLAEWRPGKTAKQVIEEADSAMYLDKKQMAKKK